MQRIADIDKSIIDSIISSYKSGIATFDIVKKYGVSQWNVVVILKKAGLKLINTRYRSGYKPHNKLPISDDEIKLLHSQGLSNTDIATKLNCEWHVIIQRIRSMGLASNRFHFNEATNLKCQIGELAYNNLSNKEWLYDQYVVQNKTTRVIAKNLNCGKKTVTTFLRKHNIPVKRIHRGVFKSKNHKCKPFWYDSYWEYMIADRLDNDSMVLKFIKDPFPIDYVADKLREYYPDFLVMLSDNDNYLLEIKPDGLLSYVENKTKSAMKFKNYVVMNVDDKFPWVE